MKHRHFPVTRRTVLRSLGFGAASIAVGHPAVTFAKESWKRGGGLDELLEQFYGETDVRPELVWQNREDVLYHDMDLPPQIAAAPEYCAFVRKAIWVFNRSTRWVRDSGAIICHDVGKELLLTGNNQASSWHTGAPNELTNEADTSLFSKRTGRRRDCAVLPAFQFRLDQHSVLELNVLEADADWQFCIGVKGRSGPPLFASAWHSGPARLTIDLASELRTRGFIWSYPELHFVIGTWQADPSKAARVRFRAGLQGRPAVATSLPVIRTAQRARAGVPITAMVLDEAGEPIGPEHVRVSAEFLGRRIPLHASGGVWRAQLQDLSVGDHDVLVSVEGPLHAHAYTSIRITDGDFLKLPHGANWVERRGEPLGPLTGSYQGTFFFKNAGQPGERMVQGQRDWDAWDRSGPDSEHMHFWESLSEDELDQRMAFLEEAGFDLTTLHSHWGCWERLDAGGCIAPHGAEQLARYLRVAARHGLHHVQALASGPYGTPDFVPEYGGTVPYSRYLEHGFDGKQFSQPAGSFDQLYNRYLDDFSMLFADESAIFAMTSAGEGDHFIGPARTNLTMRRIRSVDQNHAFLAETILMLKKLPQEHSKGYEQDRFGSRTYFIGARYLPEADLGAHFKLLSMAGCYLAEGSWSTMPSYVRFHYDVLNDSNGSPRCWTGTEHYRTRLRDTLYLGLVHLLPIMNTWDEEFAEDEHLLIAQIRRQVNWKQRFAPAPVLIGVDDAAANADDPVYGQLVNYEAALARLGIRYRLVPANEVRGGQFVLDLKGPLAALRFASDGGVIPNDIRKTILVETSEGYSVNSTVSEDGRTLLAYVYNTTRHDRQYYWLGGALHRAPSPTELSLNIQSPSQSDTRVSVYDLNTRQLVDSSSGRGPRRLRFGSTTHDYLAVMTPA